MVDNLSKKERSERMSKIRSANTKPEIIVRKFLLAKGFRYRTHSKKLPGNPDIVLPKYKTVNFINGCFWHGHEECKTWRIPLSRQEFWLAKISANKARDIKTMSKIEELQWKVIVVWECEIKNKTVALERLNKLVEEIRKE